MKRRGIFNFKKKRVLAFLVITLTFVISGILMASGANLPTVGGNSNTWGTILNDYLQAEHDVDGSHTNITAQTLILDNSSEVLNAYLNISDGVTPKLIVSPDGKVGIGTSSPETLLEIYMNTAVSTQALQLNVDAGSTSSVGQLQTVYSDGTATGSGVQIRYARGTKENPEDIQPGDRLGFLVMGGYAGGAFRNAAAINALVDSENVTSTSLPTLLQFMTTSNNSVTRTERMRIDSSGRVGIGTTSPGAKLEVANTSAYEGLLLNITNGATDFVYNATTGYVGIGMTAPQAMMHLFKSSADTTILFETNTSAETIKESSVSTPSTIAQADAPSGDTSWADLSNAVGEDDAYATATMSSSDSLSHYLKATNFGFSLPANTVSIDGIRVWIEKKRTGTITDEIVKLVKDGTVQGDNKANTGLAWSTSDGGYGSYGSDENTWGLEWTYSDINSADFGVVMQADSGGEGAIAHVDNINITVYYTVPITVPITVNWSIGIDRSDNGTFKIASSKSLGTSNDILNIRREGKVGIGTTTPTHTLNVEGSGNFTGNLTIDVNSVLTLSENITAITCDVNINNSFMVSNSRPWFCNGTEWRGIKFTDE